MAPVPVPAPPRRPRARLPLPVPLPVLLPLLLPPLAAFNLEASRPEVFRGAPGSFFGFALDFYTPEPRSVSVLVGAPKANTSQANVTQGGAVFHCPWPPQGRCTPIDFDHIGTRTHDFGGNSSEGPEPVEFKSLQWFGATVRAHNGSILACAPLYSWSPPKEEGGAREPVGSCFLSLGNFSKFVEYAPCRSDLNSAAGQGYCQGGFSAEFTQTGRVLLGGPGSFFWQGQLLSATQAQIAAGNFPEYLIQEVPGQLQTRQAEPSHDDSYMGGRKWGRGPQGGVGGARIWGSSPPSPPSPRFAPPKMASYFGYAVAATDVNNDGLSDLLVGAPLFMARSGAGGARELGRVYVFLQRPRAGPAAPAALTGTHEFGRFGSAIAALGDLDRDGYNDVAVGAPLGAEGRRGLVFIFRGGGAGLRARPAQLLRGVGAPRGQPDFFGAALRGASDLDGNGYPDLLVGAFGADAVVVYRGRPIVQASATLVIVPTMFNPEERGCVLPGGQHVSCINVTFCLNASGRHLPGPIGEGTEGGRGGTGDRVGTGDSGDVPSMSPCPQGVNESEFRDKLSPIPVSLSLALDPAVSPPPPGLSPLLAPATRTRLEAKAHIQLDCGEDNICVPDLQLEASADRRAVYLGDRNSLNVTFVARNVGEGGAYEGVSPRMGGGHHRSPPPQNFSALSCELGGGNGSDPLICDLGNPMKAGASIRGGLRFTLPHLSDSSGSVTFELQIRRSGTGGTGGVPDLGGDMEGTRAALTPRCPLRVSRPDVVTVPEGGWGPDPPQRLQDLGPPVEHVYEVVNEGPSAISQGTLELSCPLGHRGHPLLYVTGHSGLHNCSASHGSDPLRLAVRTPGQRDTGHGTAGQWDTGHGTLGTPGGLGGCPEAECFRLSCPSGGLERQQRVTLRLSFRLRTPPLRQPQLWPLSLRCDAEFRVLRLPYRLRPEGHPRHRLQVVTALSRARPEAGAGVPVWAVVLAVLLGLLLLGLLCYGLYKLGFFKRSGPYGTAMEKAQLKPQAASEA
uniref:Integrin subunit alpha 5 n=1 Tax=Taeniopygia guttata TaxID=59729 RepID=A0A674HLL4_TAEGU